MTLGELVAELEKLPKLPPRERALRARAVGAQAGAVLAAVANEAVWQLTREVTYHEAAALLGVTHSRVNHAVTAHLSRR